MQQVYPTEQLEVFSMKTDKINLFRLQSVLLSLFLIGSFTLNAHAESSGDQLADSSRPSIEIKAPSDENHSSSASPVYVLRYETPLALRHHDHFLLAQPIMYETFFGPLLIIATVSLEKNMEPCTGGWTFLQSKAPLSLRQVMVKWCFPVGEFCMA